MNMNRIYVVFFALVAVVAQGQDIKYDEGKIYPISSDLLLSPTNAWVGVENDANTLLIDDSVSFSAGSVFVGSSNSVGNALTFNPDSSGTIDNGIIIGLNTENNSMEIKEGASVSSDLLVLGAFDDADDNSVTVSGDLTINDMLVVGNEGEENQLDVSNGGSLSSSEAWVGYYDSADSNSVVVSGADSTWVNSGDLTIGTNGNSGNFVVATNGGHISVGSLEILDADENGFDLDRGGRLTVTDDFNASLEGFNFNEGGALYVEGELSGQTNVIEGGRTLGIAGDNGFWDMTGSNVVIGGTSSTNRLFVGDRGEVVADSLLVGTGSNTFANTVTVSNSSALVTVGSVEIGSTNSTDNTVELISGGKMIVDTGISISTSNTFYIGDRGHLVADFDFDASMEGFEFGQGGILETSGNLSGMTNVLDGSRSVLLTGSDAAWDLAGESLVMSSSSVRVSEGGTLTSQGAELLSYAQVSVDGAGSAWNNSGSLLVGAGATNANVNVWNGAVITSADAVIGQDGFQNAIMVSGSNSQWIASGDLVIGEDGRENRLEILDGAIVTNASAVIGRGADSAGNYALVSGDGARWNVIGDLVVGESGNDNELGVNNGGQIEVGQTLSVQNESLLKVDSGGGITANAYYQDASSLFQFDSVTNVAVDPGDALVSVAATSELESGATFEFTGDIGDVEASSTNSRLLIASSSLIVGSVTNATGDDLDVLNGNGSSSLREYGFYSENGDLYMQIFRQSLADSAGFEPGTDMYGVSEEIDAMASAGSSVANRQLNILETMSGSTQNSELSQLYDRHVPTYMHQEGLFEGMRQVRKNGVMPDTMWPVGVRGPHLYGEQVKGWIKGYGSWAEQDGEGDFSAYDQNVYGVLVGFDKAYGDLLAGLAGGYASSDISQDDGDKSESGTGYGILYGSWGSSEWFADGSIAYGMGEVENDSGTSFDASSEFDSSQFAMTLGGGKEMLFADDKLFLTPSAVFLAGWYMQDGYTEESDNSVARKVDDYDRWSMRSELGVKVEYHQEFTKRVLMPEAHLNWLHEFNADEDSVGYSLEDGIGEYNFGMQAPVADLLEIGIGLSYWAESKSGVVYEWALGFDGRFGDGYSASAINARLVAEF